MEFLVHTQLLPVDVPPDRQAELRADEERVGREYLQTGVLLRMWRVPGRRASISLWSVADADQLHELISGFPFFPWMDVFVEPLATHYLEKEGPAS